MSEESPRTRSVEVRLHLAGGHEQTLSLEEDAEALRELFTALATPESADRLVQLPVDGGDAAYSFRPSNLIAVATEPPVVVELEEVSPRPGSSVAVRRPRWLVIDDFLGPHEHQALLDYALQAEERFEGGTVLGETSTYRTNKVIMAFGESAHAALFSNRLLVWYPLIARALGSPIVALQMVESQLTATNDGHYYRTHRDSAAGDDTEPRTLTCVYYLHREPKGFGGGDLRLYDSVSEGGIERPGSDFHAVEPVSNRLAVFSSHEWHEVAPVRCPSREFADSRFAVSSWIRQGQPDAEVTLGWGHFHCGVVAPQFRDGGVS